MAPGSPAPLHWVAGLVPSGAQLTANRQEIKLTQCHRFVSHLRCNRNCFPVARQPPIRLGPGRRQQAARTSARNVSHRRHSRARRLACASPSGCLILSLLSRLFVSPVCTPVMIFMDESWRSIRPTPRTLMDGPLGAGTLDAPTGSRWPIGPGCRAADWPGPAANGRRPKV